MSAAAGLQRIASAPLALPGTFTCTSLALPESLSLDEWREAGSVLARMETGVQWWIGDWWAFGEHHYGDRKAIVEAEDWSGPSLQTCMNAATVARIFETSCRREVLSFKHHAEVAALAPDKASRLLDWCEETIEAEGRPRSVMQLRAEIKRLARAGRVAELAEAEPVAGIYHVIYADPPWRFEPYSRISGMELAADNHYPTMELDDIMALEIPAADDAVLFLWATAPMLPQALAVMAAWGFAYKSHCAWVKDQIGTGYWFRNQHELLLVGTRGTIPAPAPGEQYSSVMQLPVGAHSEKPAAFAEMIEEMYPGLRLLEMFARGPRLGWTVWGNEA